MDNPGRPRHLVILGSARQGDAIALLQSSIRLGALGAKPKGVRGLAFRTGVAEPEILFGVEGRLNVQDVETVEAMSFKALDHGYWTKYVDTATGFDDIRLDPLPKDGPLGWWHELHDVLDVDLEAGHGIRIGVIDEHSQAELRPHGVIVINASEIGGGRSAPPDAYEEHADAILSLMASTMDNEHGYVGIAPGSEYIFVSAKDHDALDARLDPTLLANAIVLLAEHYGCDLITVSAGDCLKPLPLVAAALDRSVEAGCLVFMAAGNERKVNYPACYDGCLRVGALGQFGIAPDGSFEQFHEDQEVVPLGEDYYIWHNSALEGVHLLAAGANVIWTNRDRSARAVSGTSYAAPIATSICARWLSEREGEMRAFSGPAKVRAMMRILLGACAKLTIGGKRYRIPMAAPADVAAIDILDDQHD